MLDAILCVMKPGEVLSIKLDLDSEIEYITKTRWFNKTIFVVGGMGRISPTIIEVGGKTNKQIAKEINDIVGEPFSVYKAPGIVKIRFIEGEMSALKADNNFKHEGPY